MQRQWVRAAGQRREEEEEWEKGRKRRARGGKESCFSVKKKKKKKWSYRESARVGEVPGSCWTVDGSWVSLLGLHDFRWTMRSEPVLFTSNRGEWPPCSVWPGKLPGIWTMQTRRSRSWVGKGIWAVIVVCSLCPTRTLLKQPPTGFSIILRVFVLGNEHFASFFF